MRRRRVVLARSCLGRAPQLVVLIAPLNDPLHRLDGVPCLLGSGAREQEASGASGPVLRFCAALAIVRCSLCSRACPFIINKT